MMQQSFRPVELRRLTGIDYATASGLAAIAFVVFLSALSHDFLSYDDPLYVTDNPHVNQGLTRDAITFAFTGTYAANWQPLTGLSHALDVQLFGLNASGHHFTSVFLHALNTALLFLFLMRCTGEQWKSAAVALLFGVHPLRVESVAWIAERKDVLSAFFWLLGLLFYANYTARKSPLRYAAVFAALLLGLMSKSMLVTFPFLLLVLDVWPLRRLNLDQPFVRIRLDFLALLREKIPLILLAVTISIVALVTQRSAGAMGDTAAYPFGTRVLNALYAYTIYAVHIIVPSKLAVFYPYKTGWSEAAGGAITGLLFLAGGSLVAIRNMKNAPYVLAGWCWYVGTLVPVIGIVKIGSQAFADRYTYIPSIGLVFAIVWGVFNAFEKSPAARRRLAGGVLAVAGLYAALSWHYLLFWRSSESLFRRALAVTTNNYPASINLANILIERAEPSDLEEADQILQAAMQIAPSAPEAPKHLGILRIVQNRPEEAVPLFDRAASLAGQDEGVHVLRVSTLVQLNRIADARRALDEALTSLPDSPRLIAMQRKLSQPDGASE
jgi:tetratricopeptide (TPR) repeat protein